MPHAAKVEANSEVVGIPEGATPITVTGAAENGAESEAAEFSWDSTAAQWKVRNSRRIALILKEIENPLTPDESVELERLQQEAGEYIKRAAPLPMEYVRSLVDESQIPIHSVQRGEHGE